MLTTIQFHKKIWDHYRAHRREMPWRKTHDPYKILVSEIMLQQTQVARVVGFYENFIKKFPNVRTLAKAKTVDVLRAWQGLGYNRRALALQKLAKEVLKNYQSKLPKDLEKLLALPGIGNYTARAIRAFAFNEPEIFIETNIRRVFIHFFYPRRQNVTDVELRRYIERTVDKKKPREWYYALMDFGAMLGETMRGSARAKNPNRRSAHYSKQSIFAGSDRELRGKILRELLSQKKILLPEMPRKFEQSQEKIEKVVGGLIKEGFLSRQGKHILIKKL